MRLAVGAPLCEDRHDPLELASKRLAPLGIGFMTEYIPICRGWFALVPAATALLFFQTIRTATAQPANWANTGSLNDAPYEHTATLLPNGQVLVAGGFDNAGLTNSAELYNPATGTWTLTGSLNTARSQHTATLLPNGQVLVAGGYDYGGPTTGAELYNPTTGTWTATGSLHTARYDHTATLLPNGQVLVSGGYGNSGPMTSAELYNPTTG